jgi:glucosamine-phosphate N-acetyltransferase
MNEEFTLRELEIDDYYKNYFELLSQLTLAPKPSYEEWGNRVQEIQRNGLYKIFVVEFEKIIVGTITIVIELKFIRGLGKIGHIEDFVIDNDHRNKKLGAKLINTAVEFCRSINCYKVILDSSDEVKGFYEKMGFKAKANNMVIYFNS